VARQYTVQEKARSRVSSGFRGAHFLAPADAAPTADAAAAMVAEADAEEDEEDADEDEDEDEDEDDDVDDDEVKLSISRMTAAAISSAVITPLIEPSSFLRLRAFAVLDMVM
jgi:hypothetical protein